MRWIYSLLLFAGIIYQQVALCQQFKYDQAGSFKNGMAPVYVGQQMQKNVGFIDKTGKEIVPAIYEEDYLPDEFIDGVAIVTKNGLSGVVDKTGKLVVPCEFKHIATFSEGIAEAYKPDGKVGFINTQGKAVTPFQYSIIALLGGIKCVNGMIPVRNQAGKNGYIDKTGKLVVPFNYEEITNFSDGLGKVKTRYNGKVSYVNTKGEIAIPEKYDDGTIFKDGLAYVNIGARAKSIYSGLEGGKWGVIDKTGKEIVPIIYDHIDEIINGFTIVVMGKYPNEKKGLIGRDGKMIMPVEYYDIKVLKDRIVANKVFVGPYALFDYAGKQIGDYQWNLYDIFPEITDGLLRVHEVKNNKLGKVGAIDVNGVLKIPFMYDAMSPFQEGLSAVSLNNKYGAIDKTGKTVIPFQYDGLGSFSEGWAPVLKDRKYGFINKAGKLMEFSKTTTSTPVAGKNAASAESYQAKEKLLDFYVVVNGSSPTATAGENTGGKFGILSKDEKLIIPAKYDWLSLDTSMKAFFVQTGVAAYYGAGLPTRIEPSANTRIGILGYDGKQLYPPTLSTYLVMPGKHILIKDAVSSKWGMLNAAFKTIVPVNYEQLYRFTDSAMAAKKNGKIGIINLKNETLVPFEYDSVFQGGNRAPGGYQLRKNGSAIWVDAKGRILQGGPEPYETNFQTALGNARDSKERANALMNFLNPVYAVTDSVSFAKLVKQKLDIVAAIDFYAIHVVAIKNKDVNHAKITRFFVNAFTPEQRSVFNKYSQCIIDNFSRTQNNQPELPCPPAGTPQPGQPWKN